ncbi:MAG: amidohydrolase family protein [Verrucomicrobia bacterium]|nr:amidohydrolase family protein [Verrucomicrobiota bacterium]
MASDRAQHVAAEVTRLANLPASLLTSAATREPVWLHVGTLLDGTSTAPARDAHIVYDSIAIRFVGRDGRTPPRELLRPNQAAPDFVAPDHTLLPGLIEAHAHLFLEGGELNLDRRAAYLKQTPAELLAAARARLEKIVRLGVIAVRDAGDKDGVGLALSKQYKDQRCLKVGQVSDLPLGESETRPASDRSPAPLMAYLDSPGAAIHHRGRYGSFMGEPLENFPTPHACVAARVAAGADRIKLIPTGIINFKAGAVTTEPQMGTAEVAALVTAAKSFGRQTFAHASGDRGIEHVVEGGADSVEHGFFIRDDQLARLRDRQIAWVPTFAPVQEQVDHAALMGWDAAIVAHLQRILDQHAASLVRAHALGVPIIAGSDAGSVGVAHAIGLLDELALMERAGLPPLAVINAATGVSAGRLGYREKFGRLAPGCLSRFILTRHSPLATVANLRLPRTIVFDGQVFETDATADVTGL